MNDYTAVFPTVAAAKAYAAAIAAPGNWSKSITQKGRTVTWDLDLPAHRTADDVYFSDLLERVGYYGSTQSRKATLNGVPAPAIY